MADSDDLIDEDPPADGTVTVRSSSEGLPAFGAPVTVFFLTGQRDALLQRVAEIETLLGFVSTSEDLSVRVAAIERFVGLKP